LPFWGRVPSPASALAVFFSALAVFSRNALYKSTFYLLTYLLTRELIGVKFRSVKRTHVFLGRAKVHINRCNESLLRGENADLWPVSKFNK